MVEDEEGFEYPQIDESKCVRCYQCLKVCPFKVVKASEMRYTESGSSLRCSINNHTPLRGEQQATILWSAEM